MARVNFRIEGMRELRRSLDRLGRTPQKHVTSSAKKGMNVVLKESKASAPYDTGELKKGMILKGERSNKRGKKVYQIVFDPRKNEIFQKKNADGRITGYYPISQEYGFFTVNGRYVPGYRFIHGSFERKADDSQRKIVSEMKKKIDEQITRERLR